MNANHDGLEVAKSNDISWVAKIIVQKDDTTYVDIVTLLGINKCCWSSYPKNTSFVFEHFLGVDDSQKLTIYLIEAAKKCGTSLVVGSTNKCDSKFRLMTIQLQCVKYRLSRTRSKRSFSDSFIQTPCTQIKQSQSTSIIKGKSRSKSKKNCHSAVDDKSQGTTVKRRKYSSVRPMQIEDKCSFYFRIMCSKKDRKWYLMHNSKDNSENNCHKNHTPALYKHTALKKDYVSSEIKSFNKNLTKGSNRDSSFYNQAHPAFEEMMNSCSTSEQCNKIIEHMKGMHYNHIKEKEFTTAI